MSRYRLDEYLQLFDFPSPNLSAEKRFATTVPLQRLFFMNSDFVQQQAEHLAQRVASEPDNTARIQKLYQLCMARGDVRRSQARHRLSSHGADEGVRRAEGQGTAEKEKAERKSEKESGQRKGKKGLRWPRRRSEADEPDQARR